MFRSGRSSNARCLSVVTSGCSLGGTGVGLEVSWGVSPQRRAATAVFAVGTQADCLLSVELLPTALKMLPPQSLLLYEALHFGGDWLQLHASPPAAETPGLCVNQKNRLQASSPGAGQGCVYVHILSDPLINMG